MSAHMLQCEATEQYMFTQKHTHDPNLPWQCVMNSIIGNSAIPYIPTSQSTEKNGFDNEFASLASHLTYEVLIFLIH